MDENDFEIRVINRLIKWIEGLGRFFTRINSKLASLLSTLRHQKYEKLFGEYSTDIYIASYPKSGTTWMQMLVYQLTTDGSMDFEHIYEVSPWLRNQSYKNEPLPPTLPEPRIIKTHDPYQQVSKNKKGRFIFVLRDGADIAASLYHHRRDYGNDSIDFDESFKLSFEEAGKENWFEFTSLWLQNPHQFPILYIHYEDLKADVHKEASKIAEFLGVPYTAEVKARVAERCTFEYMKAHESKFGEQPSQKKPQLVYNNFIRKGETGKGAEYMNAKQQTLYSQQLAKHFSKFPQMKGYIVNAVKRMAPSEKM